MTTPTIEQELLATVSGLAGIDPTEKNLLHHEIHFHSAEAPWIVMIHGAGGSTVTWKRQPADLGISNNLLLVDLPGHGQMAGRSQHMTAYSFEQISLLVWEVIEELRIGKVHLVGISLGTIITLTMRNQHPERVASLINGGIIVRLSTALKVLSHASLGLAKIIGYPAFYRLSARIMLPKKNHSQSRKVFVRESRALSTEEFRKWTAMYKGLNGTLKRLFESASDVPHLIIMGEQDHFFVKQAKAYALIHPTVSLRIVPKCGHVVSIERAADFNRLCLQHLEGLAGRAM